MMITCSEALASFHDYMVDIRHLSEHTVKAYMHDLELYREYLEVRGTSLEEAAFEDARRFVARLRRRSYCEKSINRIISAVKSFYSYLVTYEYVTASPFADVRSMKREVKLPSVMTRQEVELLIGAPAEDTFGSRDRTIFSLLYSTGCRLAEMLGIDVGDIQLEQGRILVHGKGARDRYVFLTGEAKEHLKGYLLLREQFLLKFPPERALFINKRGKRLTPQGVHYIFHTYVRMLGIAKHVTPHTFRHTFATHILDNDAGIRVVQELLGHQNVSTTQIYSHVSTRRLKDVYKKSHPHGRRR